MQNWWNRKRARFEESGKLTQWEQDYTLSENEGLFQEYLEMGAWMDRVNIDEKIAIDRKHINIDR